MTHKRLFLLNIAFSFVYFSSSIAVEEKHESQKFLDKTFGNNGVVFTDFGTNSGTFNRIVPAIHLKTKSDGKIIVVGDTYRDYNDLLNPSARLALAQYNSNGEIDTTFGDKGKMQLAFSNDPKDNSFGIDLAIQNDNKVIVIGRLLEKRSESHPGQLSDPVIARFNSNGSIDTTFGYNGFIVERSIGTNWSNFFRVELQADGKIVVVGNYGTHSPSGNKDAQVWSLDSCCFYVARYNKDGTADTSFGNKGKIKTILKSKTLRAPGDEAASLAIQSDGKIIVVGSYENALDMNLNPNEASKSSNCAIVRYDARGNLDRSFGPEKDGMVITPINQSFFTDVVIQPDNKIVAIGSTKNSYSNHYEVLLVRYTKDGLLDASFGQNGIVITQVGNEDAFAKNVALGKDGKILVTGTAKYNGHMVFTLVRYTTDGKLDTTLDEKGIVFTPLRDINDKSFALTIQNDQKVIVAGDSFNGNYFDFALVRYIL